MNNIRKSILFITLSNFILSHLIGVSSFDLINPAYTQDKISEVKEIENELNFLKEFNQKSIQINTMLNSPLEKVFIITKTYENIAASAQDPLDAFIAKDIIIPYFNALSTSLEISYFKESSSLNNEIAEKLLKYSTRIESFLKKYSLNGETPDNRQSLQMAFSGLNFLLSKNLEKITDEKHETVKIDEIFQFENKYISQIEGKANQIMILNEFIRLYLKRLELYPSQGYSDNKKAILDHLYELTQNKIKNSELKIYTICNLEPYLPQTELEPKIKLLTEVLAEIEGLDPTIRKKLEQLEKDLRIKSSNYTNIILDKYINEVQEALKSIPNQSPDGELIHQASQEILKKRDLKQSKDLLSKLSDSKNVINETTLKHLSEMILSQLSPKDKENILKMVSEQIEKRKSNQRNFDLKTKPQQDKDTIDAAKKVLDYLQETGFKDIDGDTVKQLMALAQKKDNLTTEDSANIFKLLGPEKLAKIANFLGPEISIGIMKAALSLTKVLPNSLIKAFAEAFSGVNFQADDETKSFFSNLFSGFKLPDVDLELPKLDNTNSNSNSGPGFSFNFPTPDIDFNITGFFKRFSFDTDIDPTEYKTMSDLLNATDLVQTAIYNDGLSSIRQKTGESTEQYYIRTIPYFLKSLETLSKLPSAQVFIDNYNFDEAHHKFINKEVLFINGDKKQTYQWPLRSDEDKNHITSEFQPNLKLLDKVCYYYTYNNSLRSAMDSYNSILKSDIKAIEESSKNLGSKISIGSQKHLNLILYLQGLIDVLSSSGCSEYQAGNRAYADTIISFYEYAVKKLFDKRKSGVDESSIVVLNWLTKNDILDSEGRIKIGTDIATLAMRIKLLRFISERIEFRQNDFSVNTTSSLLFYLRLKLHYYKQNKILNLKFYQTYVKEQNIPHISLSQFEAKLFAPLFQKRAQDLRSNDHKTRIDAAYLLFNVDPLDSEFITSDFTCKTLKPAIAVLENNIDIVYTEKFKNTLTRLIWFTDNCHEFPYEKTLAVNAFKKAISKLKLELKKFGAKNTSFNLSVRFPMWLLAQSKSLHPKLQQYSLDLLTELLDEIKSSHGATASVELFTATIKNHQYINPWNAYIELHGFLIKLDSPYKEIFLEKVETAYSNFNPITKPISNPANSEFTGLNDKQAHHFQSFKLSMPYFNMLLLKFPWKQTKKTDIDRIKFIKDWYINLKNEEPEFISKLQSEILHVNRYYNLNDYIKLTDELFEFINSVNSDYKQALTSAIEIILPENSYIFYSLLTHLLNRRINNFSETRTYISYPDYIFKDSLQTTSPDEKRILRTLADPTLPYQSTELWLSSDQESKDQVIQNPILNTKTKSEFSIIPVFRQFIVYHDREFPIEVAKGYYTNHLDAAIDGKSAFYDLNESLTLERKIDGNNQEQNIQFELVSLGQLVNQTLKTIETIQNNKTDPKLKSSLYKNLIKFLAQAKFCREILITRLKHKEKIFRDTNYNLPLWQRDTLDKANDGSFISLSPMLQEMYKVLSKNVINSDDDLILSDEEINQLVLSNRNLGEPAPKFTVFNSDTVTNLKKFQKLSKTSKETTYSDLIDLSSLIALDNAHKSFSSDLIKELLEDKSLSSNEKDTLRDLLYQKIISKINGIHMGRKYLSMDELKNLDEKLDKDPSLSNQDSFDDYELSQMFLDWLKLQKTHNQQLVDANSLSTGFKDQIEKLWPQIIRIQKLIKSKIPEFTWRWDDAQTKKALDAFDLFTSRLKNYNVSTQLNHFMKGDYVYFLGNSGFEKGVIKLFQLDRDGKATPFFENHYRNSNFKNYLSIKYEKFMNATTQDSQLSEGLLFKTYGKTLETEYVALLLREKSNEVEKTVKFIADLLQIRPITDSQVEIINQLWPKIQNESFGRENNLYLGTLLSSFLHNLKKTHEFDYFKVVEQNIISSILNQKTPSKPSHGSSDPASILEYALFDGLEKYSHWWDESREVIVSHFYNKYPETIAKLYFTYGKKNFEELFAQKSDLGNSKLKRSDLLELYNYKKRGTTPNILFELYLQLGDLQSSIDDALKGKSAHISSQEISVFTQRLKQKDKSEVFRKSGFFTEAIVKRDIEYAVNLSLKPGLSDFKKLMQQKDLLAPEVTYIQQALDEIKAYFDIK